MLEQGNSTFSVFSALYTFLHEKLVKSAFDITTQAMVFLLGCKELFMFSVRMHV